MRKSPSTPLICLFGDMMGIKLKTNLLVAVLLVGLGLLAQNALAQTRLGLHVTQEELNIWRQRALNGPYKSRGDTSTNSPADWDRIVANANAFASNPSSGRWTTGPTLLSGSCVGRDAGGTNDPPSTAQSWAQRVRDAAFYDLIMGVTIHHTAIKAELLWQATQSWADFSNVTRWCTGVVYDINPNFVISAWLTKLLFAYDYMGRSAFTVSERNILDQWLWSAADYMRIDVDRGIDSVFIDRWNNNYAPTQGCVYGSPTDGYVGSPQIGNYAKFYNNRRASLLRFSGLVAIYLADHGFIPTQSRVGATLNTLKQSAKMFVKEWIRFSVFPQGMYGEFERRDVSLPDLGWAYTGGTLGSAVVIADHFARAGDTELYTHNTSAGLCNTAGTINDGGSRTGQNRDLLFAVQTLMKYTNDTYARFWPTNGDPNSRIDGRHPRDGSSWSGVHDTNVVPANLYFQDNVIKSTYMRTHIGTVPYPANPQGGPPPWTGENGIYPAMLFMFGDMEGDVWPYNTGGQGTTLNLMASPSTIASAGSSSLTWSTTNASSCSASGGWTGTKAISGTQTVTPNQTTVYTLSCTGTGGSASKTVTVSVSSSDMSSNLANSSTLIAHSNNFSTTSTRGPEKLWDGDTVTEDGSTGNSGISSFWVEFDLGKLHDLTKIRLFGDADGNWICQTWRFEYRQNQSDSYAVAFANNPCKGNQWFEQALTGTRARFVRMTVFGDPVIFASQARELDIQGIPVVPPTPPTNVSLIGS
jgi:hypothetical protein